MPKNFKRIKALCPICEEEALELKCNICTYECCSNCIYEWSKTSFECPQCKQYKTYDIEYIDSDSFSESSDEFYEPFLGFLFYEPITGLAQNYSIGYFMNYSLQVSTEEDEEDEEDEAENYFSENQTAINSLYLLFEDSPPPPPSPSPSLS